MGAFANSQNESLVWEQIFTEGIYKNIHLSISVPRKQISYGEEIQIKVFAKNVSGGNIDITTEFWGHILYSAELNSEKTPPKQLGFLIGKTLPNIDYSRILKPKEIISETIIIKPEIKDIKGERVGRSITYNQSGILKIIISANHKNSKIISTKIKIST